MIMPAHRTEPNVGRCFPLIVANHSHHTKLPTLMSGKAPNSQLTHMAHAAHQMNGLDNKLMLQKPLQSVLGSHHFSF